MVLSVEDPAPLASRTLFASIKFNIFTFILLLFSSHLMYIPILREYAKLGFDYGNTILVFALIYYLISFAIISLSAKRREN
tara:strand:+ start:230 stop:472 length:243 start_codon:yes stop_codon:yes gene_type:complete